MKYTDPDGRIAIPLALFAAAVVGFLYFQTPAGQQGLQAIEDILYFGCYGAALGCYGTAKAIETVVSIVNSKVEEQTKNKNYVYHHTGSKTFIDNLKSTCYPSSVIDFSYTDPDSRFGKCFYVASDPVTAEKEASNPGVVIKLEMAENANILDLTDPEIAEKYGYSNAMPRDDARYLMRNWNLTGVDAIKYPSEKNPGGYNYAVLNPLILN